MFSVQGSAEVVGRSILGYFRLAGARRSLAASSSLAHFLPGVWKPEPSQKVLSDFLSCRHWQIRLFCSETAELAEHQLTERFFFV